MNNFFIYLVYLLIVITYLYYIMEQKILNVNYSNEFIFDKYVNINGLRNPKILFIDKKFLFGSQKL